MSCDLGRRNAVRRIRIRRRIGLLGRGRRLQHGYDVAEHDDGDHGGDGDDSRGFNRVPRGRRTGPRSALDSVLAVATAPAGLSFGVVGRAENGRGHEHAYQHLPLHSANPPVASTRTRTVRHPSRRRQSTPESALRIGRRSDIRRMLHRGHAGGREVRSTAGFGTFEIGDGLTPRGAPEHQRPQDRHSIGRRPPEVSGDLAGCE